MQKHELKVIVESIISLNTVDNYVKFAKNLSDYYKKITTNRPSEINETVVKGGVALSSSGAADCVDDYLRTVYFIKGVHKALTKLCNDFPDRSINILYAGCGPYATLILPLLPLFDKGRINAILLDINASSIESVHNLISVIGLDDYQLQLIETDAITYRTPNDFIIDLAISETMHYGLTREPQVAIVKNIVPQLPPHGILIPEAISIDLTYTFFDYEPYLKNAINEVKGHNELQPYLHRVFVDRLFTVNKELFSSPSYDCKFESNFYELPDNFTNHPDVCVFTELIIYDDIELKTAESYITNPYCIVSMYSLTGYSGIQLVYDFSDIPQWSHNLKERVVNNPD
ncbi:SAM-dependent methyltransferase [Flavobacterium hauense]